MVRLLPCGLFKGDKLAKFGGKTVILRVFIISVLLAYLSACGGGASGGDLVGNGETLPAKILIWIPPSQYTDGAPLNPLADLDRFEIYINQNGSFSNADNEMAAVAARDPASGQINTSFNLANLSPFLSQGVSYYVSVRAVALTGVKSGFSSSETFSF